MYARRNESQILQDDGKRGESLVGDGETPRLLEQRIINVIVWTVQDEIGHLS